MKKLIAMLLAVLMVIGLFAGCGEQAPSNDPVIDPNTGEAKTPVTLSWWAFESDVNSTKMIDWAERLHETYPWITVQWTWLPPESAGEKMKVAFATHTYPDIIADMYGRLAPAVDAGLTISLQPAVDKIPGLILAPEGIVDGEPHYIWQSNSTGYSLSCNMELARQLGIEEYLPDDGMSWGYEDLLACLRAAKEAGYMGIDLFAGSNSSDMWYYTFFLAAGAELIDVENKKAVMNVGENKEKCLEVLQLLKTIYDEGLCQTGAATTIDQEAQAIWFTGRMLFCHGAWSNVANWVNQINAGSSLVTDFEMFSVPSPQGGEWPVSAAFSSSGLIAFDTDNGAKLDAIYTAIAFYFNEEGGLMADYRTSNPTTASVVEYDKPLEDAADVFQINQVQRGNKQVELGLVRNDWGPSYGWYDDFRYGFYPQLQNFYLGDITAEQLLDNWAEYTQKVLDDYYKNQQ